MLFNTGGDRKNVRVEYDVFGRKVGLTREQVERTFADLELALHGVGLPLLVERHDDDGGAVEADSSCLFEKALLAFFQADRIDDPLALQAFQACFDDRPLGRVDHDRHTRDVRLGGQQVQVANHRAFRIQHALVHVYVDDLRAVGNLLSRDVNGAVVILRLDQPAEFRRTGNVAALTDIGEQAVRAQVEWLEAAEPAASLDRRPLPRGQSIHGSADRGNVIRRRAAAAADDIDEAAFRVIANQGRGLRGRFVVFAKCIGQAGVRIGANVGFGNA